MSDAAAVNLNVASHIAGACFRSRDVEETHRHCAGLIANHRLSAYGSGFESELHSQKLGALSFLQMQFGSPVLVEPGQIDQFLLVQMPLAGSSRVLHSRGAAVLTPEVAGVIAPAVPFRIRWERDCRQLILRIPRQKLEQACTTYIGRNPGKPIEFTCEMDLRTGTGAGWRQLMSYVLCNLALARSQPVNPLALAQVEEMILAHLLVHQPHNYTEQMADSADVRLVLPKCVRRAEEYMENNLLEPISLSDIAEHAGVKIRTLLNSFQNFRNVSPMAALRDMRLERARSDLVSGAGTSVTDIAYRWGFNHLGRFAMLYKERFGETPGETLRR